jgi:hypothetical protein
MRVSFCIGLPWASVTVTPVTWCQCPSRTGSCRPCSSGLFDVSTPNTWHGTLKGKKARFIELFPTCSTIPDSASSDLRIIYLFIYHELVKS